METEKFSSVFIDLSLVCKQQLTVPGLSRKAFLSFSHASKPLFTTTSSA